MEDILKPINAYLHGIGLVLFLLHLIVLMSYSLNIPMFDEWGFLENDALSKTLSIPWLFELNNEHRIVLTKLQTWLLYRFGGWNLNTNVMINFIIYAGFAFLLVRTLEEKYNVSLGFVLILAASALPWGNHYHPFQSQFHFFLICFFPAVMTALRYDRWNNAGPAFAVIGAYSFSAGVICAIVYIGFLIVLARSRRSMRSRYIIHAAATGVAIGVWFIGFHTNPAHPALIMPWQHTLFWDHFLNAISTGFGYESLSNIPGTLALSATIGLSIRQIVKARGLSESQRSNYIALFVIILGILGSLASISTARAAFGPAQAKTSRYTEISMLLIPLMWILIVSASRELPRLLSKIACALALLAIIVPFYNDFGWKSVYSKELEKKLATRQCLGDYYIRGRGDGNCFMSCPGSLADKLIRAEQLGIVFIHELN